MAVVNQEQIVPANFVHGYQIADRLLKCAEGFVVIKVADMLADKGLAVDHQRDGIFQVGAQCENGTFGRKRCDRARSVTTGAA